MEILIYILKSTAVVSLFYLIYLGLLKEETFFKSNRKFLLGGIFMSFCLPFMVFTQIVYKEMPVFDFEIPEGAVTIEPQVASDFNFEIWDVLMLVYGIGVVVMLGLFVKKLISLLAFLRSHQFETQNGFQIIQVNGLDAPFSFFKYIVVDQTKYSASDFEMILEHEQSHARQYHSIDTLLMQLMLVINWFNPLAWLYKSAVVQNLEYLADATTAGKLNNHKNYQLALVKVAVPGQVPALTHSFYQSLIKKRIVMLNKQSSSEFSKWKMLLVVPVLAAFMWSFNVKEDIRYKEANVVSVEGSENATYSTLGPSGDAPENEARAISGSEEVSDAENNQVQNENITPDNIEDTPKTSSGKSQESKQKPYKKVITPTMTESEIKSIVDELDTEYNIDMQYSKLNYNSDGEIIQITVEIKDRESKNAASASFKSDEKPLGHIVVYRTPAGEFGVVSGRNNFADSEAMSRSMDERRAEMEMRRAEMDERRKEMELRKEEMHAEMVLRKEEIQAEMEARKAELDAERELRMKEMEERKAALEERVVVGYGKNSRFKTPDSSYINPKEKILFGAPNDGFSIRTYGTGDRSDEQPLFIKDGKEIKQEELNMINPKEIESISILKDASATKVYGEKGEYGVVLITTKSKKN